jgi:class 3 adenylate cyclase/tetratricopeptide (TPR) repeat protein
MDKIDANFSTTETNVGGEHKVISVLFTDVVNYTSLSEKLELEAVHEVINSHFKLLIEAVNRYEGTVDQLLGDGMLAFFGAPTAYEDHAQRACYAALAIQESIKDYAEKLYKQYGIDFNIRIGMNSGPVLVGQIGNAQHREYIAIGDTVNLASRMENASRPGGILVTENVFNLTKDFFRFEPIGEIGIKGKEKPVAAFRLLQGMKTERRFEAAVAKGLTRFVGRENELGILNEAFANVLNGHSQIVSIKGEPGIGKSRLLREFNESLNPKESTSLEGHCLHYGSLMPYRPLIDILKTYFKLEEIDSEASVKDKMTKSLGQMDRSLLSYLPFFYEMFSLKVEDERFQRMENQYKRNKLFEGILNLLLKEASIRPLIISIEDLHWMDKTSEDLLSYLMDRIEGSRILFILLYRPEYLCPWTRQSNYREVHLGQLSSSVSSELLEALLPDEKPGSELQKTVILKTGGNPLFVEEFVHSLVDSGSIGKENEKYTLNLPDSTIKLPDTIQGIIAARVDRLPEKLKNTLQVAAVMGRDFSYNVLQDVTGLHEELKIQLETLQRLEFIIPKEISPDTEYIFKHALIHEVVFDCLLQKRKEELHEIIGQSIERLYPERLEELVEVLAYHYRQSSFKNKAIEYLRRSARKARNRYTIEESHNYYQQAFEIITNKENRNREEQSELLDIILEWAEVYYYRGNFRTLIDILVRHEKLAEESGEKSRYAMFLGWFGICYYAVGRIRESYNCLRRGLTLAEETGNQKAIAYNCAWLAWTCEVLGHIEEGFGYAEKGIEVSRQLQGDDYPYIKALGGYGFLLSSFGKNRKALECANKMLEFGETHGNLRSLALGYCIGAFCHFNNGEVSTSLNDCLQGLKLNVDRFYFEVLRFAIGYVYVLTGKFQEAETTLNEVVVHSKQYGLDKLEWTALALLGVVSISRGQMAQGFRIINEVNDKYLKNEANRDLMTNEYILGTVYSQMANPTGPFKISMLIKNLVFLLSHAPFAYRRGIAHYGMSVKIAKEYGFKSGLVTAYLGLGQLYKQKGKKTLARETLTATVKMCRDCEAPASLKQAEELLASLDGK